MGLMGLLMADYGGLQKTLSGLTSQLIIQVRRGQELEVHGKLDVDL